MYTCIYFQKEIRVQKLTKKTGHLLPTNYFFNIITISIIIKKNKIITIIIIFAFLRNILNFFLFSKKIKLSISCEKMEKKWQASFFSRKKSRSCLLFLRLVL